MSNSSQVPSPSPLGTIASHLGVPRPWLEREGRAGRIPHILAGKVILADLDVVRGIIAAKLAAVCTEGAK